MKNEQILSRMAVGEIVTSGQILSALYRRGFISAYSQWGYLEGERVYYKDDFYGKDKLTTEYRLYHTFSKGTRKLARDYDNPFKDLDELREVMGHEGEFEYLGCKFRHKYLDGCFSPYLQLVEKNGDSEQTSHPSICLWGSIC